MGLAVAAFGLLGLGLVYYFFGGDPETAHHIHGFGMGASVVALFSRVGGGIYTKSADVGADLVGKLEQGIPEDDPRNPGVIADNVGDNVGDVAGMGSDIFESYCGSMIATIAIASTLAALGVAQLAPGLSEADGRATLMFAPLALALYRLNLLHYWHLYCAIFLKRQPCRCPAHRYDRHANTIHRSRILCDV